MSCRIYFGIPSAKLILKTDYFDAGCENRFGMVFSKKN